MSTNRGRDDVLKSRRDGSRYNIYLYNAAKERVIYSRPRRGYVSSSGDETAPDALQSNCDHHTETTTRFKHNCNTQMSLKQMTVTLKNAFPTLETSFKILGTEQSV